MFKRDLFDVKCSLAAVAADAIAVFAGFVLAIWIRFDSGWLALHKGLPNRLPYLFAALVGVVLFLVVFRWLGLYERPQSGHYTEKIPRIVRASGVSILLCIVAAFLDNQEPPISRLAIGVSFFTTTFLVIIERNILFQMERHYAKYQGRRKKVVVLGTGQMAADLQHSLKREPRLRSEIIAFLIIDHAEVDSSLDKKMVRGHIGELPALLEQYPVDEVILANPGSLSHQQMVDIILACERNMADFHMIPDTFGVLTSSMTVEYVEGIPLLGLNKWPLDYYANRVSKRIEDLIGSLIGLLLSIPIMLVCIPLIRRGSAGPVFYRQQRCGRRGKVFILYKLRTMNSDAEELSGPVWTTPDDPRITPVGRFLRRHNLDELPQFWNVLKGDMSLVGPRPERPHFVDQFKEDVNLYMRRHASRPGMTGWAQVNGLRGNTSVRERIKFDLYYLENWSLAFDFKILAKTFVNRENAY